MYLSWGWFDDSTLPRSYPESLLSCAGMIYHLSFICLSYSSHIIINIVFLPYFQPRVPLQTVPELGEWKLTKKAWTWTNWLVASTFTDISCCENHLRLLAKRVERVLEERPDLLQLLLPNISRVLGCLSLKEKKLACRECLPAVMISIISLVLIMIIQVTEPCNSVLILASSDPWQGCWGLLASSFEQDHQNCKIWRTTWTSRPPQLFLSQSERTGGVVCSPSFGSIWSDFA